MDQWSDSFVFQRSLIYSLKLFSRLWVLLFGVIYIVKKKPKKKNLLDFEKQIKYTNIRDADQQMTSDI